MINLPFFDDAHRQLHRRLGGWATGGLGEISEDAEFETRRLVKVFGEAGWLKYVVGEIDVRSLCLLRETFAYHHGLADFAFAMQGLGTGAISLFGTEVQKQRYLPPVVRGERIAAFAISERDAGSDVGAMKASARRDGEGWILDGEKTWISNAGIADHYVVFARIPELGEKAYGAFIVDASDVVVAERIVVMAPHVLGTIRLEGCRVGANALIGELGGGLKVALATLDVFRTSVAAAALGFARRALDESVAHVRSRVQFGKPLAEFQLTQARIADMALAVDAAALLVYRAAWKKDRGAARITREAAMAKLFATEQAQKVIDDAVQLHGGVGLVVGETVERLYREIRALRIYEGTSEIQKLVIAGQVMPPPFHRVDTFARDHLPPRELWPVMRYDAVPDLAYPPHLNTATELLDRIVGRGDGERTAFHFPGGTWTYSHLLATSNRIANVLVDDYGLIPGQRVLLRAPNNPMLAACWFAVLKAGGIVVCTMPLLRSRELQYILNHAHINLAITDARFSEDLEQAISQSPGPPVPLLRFGNGELEGLLDAAKPEFTNVATANDDVAIIAYTSGTTGDAKATVHFHRDMIAVCDLFPKYVLKPDRDDIFCGSPPFAFTFGLGGLVLFPMRIGASALLLEQAAPPQLIEAIARYQPTILFTSPTAYRALLAKVKDFDISSLKKCVSAGETLPLPTYQAWQEATGIQIIDGIGATEMLHIFISASGADIRPGATGRVVPGYEARIVDDEMNDVAIGEVGKLAVRGPTGCRYLSNEERQRVYVRNGWNLTGDAYRMDEDGYFWYQARTDDMIVSSGYNISGPEVENVLLDHPAVLECGVVGVPSEERGQIVKAFIVLRPEYEPDDALMRQLQDFVKQQIAPYKYPRSIQFMSALPRTSTGKLQRFKLRELEP